MVIPIHLAAAEKQVHLTLYRCASNQRVRELWDGPLEAGTHRFVWDGRDDKDKALPAGVY